jgi:hypothetical protein
MGRECIITAMPAEVHYDGGLEADRKRIPAVPQRRKKTPSIAPRRKR